MTDIESDRRSDATSTERYEVVGEAQPGSLSHDVSGFLAESSGLLPEQEGDYLDDGVVFATLRMIDGSVVARLPCDESLGTVIVGRGSLSSVRLYDPFVHRVHAEVHWDSESNAHVITHSGGANGTIINMQRIDRPTRLGDGTRIRFGKTELVYRRFRFPGV
jgi:hypothetical protein